MSDKNQSQGGVVRLVGMDAHTWVLSLCVAEWRHGSDPKVRRNIPNVLLEDMEKVYERWIPEDALTLVESSGNTSIIVNRLKVIGRKEITYAWYILSGEPSPNRDMQDFYERKHERSYSEVGRATMAEFGYPTRRSFVESVSAEVYAHLSERSSELQT